MVVCGRSVIFEAIKRHSQPRYLGELSRTFFRVVIMHL